MNSMSSCDENYTKTLHQLRKERRVLIAMRGEMIAARNQRIDLLFCACLFFIAIAIFFVKKWC
jgi:hypothetical protein